MLFNGVLRLFPSMIYRQAQLLCNQPPVLNWHSGKEACVSKQAVDRLVEGRRLFMSLLSCSLGPVKVSFQSCNQFSISPLRREGLEPLISLEVLTDLVLRQVDHLRAIPAYCQESFIGQLAFKGDFTVDAFAGLIRYHQLLVREQL
jgi:hypothetical protein